MRSLLAPGVALLALVCPGAWAAGAPAQRASPAIGGEITLIRTPMNLAAWIDGVASHGRTRTIWRCPGHDFCGDLVSEAWSRDGRYLAISLAWLGSQTPYVGLHVIDTKTRRDLHLIRRPPPRGSTTFDRQDRRYGCAVPAQLAWSPDGSRLAYSCPVAGMRPGAAHLWQTTRIHLVDRDGSHPLLLRTRTRGAAWPSWSPDGRRLAFSTGVLPRQHPWNGSGVRNLVTRSSLMTIDLQTGDLSRVARDASAPTWSPDGRVIAYRSACGRVRLVTARGRDATPGGHAGSCPGIGPAGWPAWAPDGRALAIASRDGISLVRTDGRQLERIGRTAADLGIAGEVRAAWRR